MTSVWTIEHAQEQLLQLIDDADILGPQTITRDGQALAVVVASHEWDSILNKEPETPSSAQAQIERAQMQTGNLKNFICG